MSRWVRASGAARSGGSENIRPRRARKLPPDNQPAEAGIISTEVACQLLMLSRQRIDQLVAAGHLQRHAPGRFRTVDVVQGYIRFLRDEDRRSSKSAADSRMRDAKAREIEVRTQQRLSRLVPQASGEA
jgi:hypothetical protein